LFIQKSELFSIELAAPTVVI